MAIRELIEKIVEKYAELMSKDEGASVVLSPFLLGLITALIPPFHVQLLITAMFFIYQSLETYIVYKTKGNGQTVAEFLSDVRGFVTGYVIAAASRWLGLNL